MRDRGIAERFRERDRGIAERFRKRDRGAAERFRKRDRLRIPRTCTTTGANGARETNGPRRRR